MIDGGGRRLPSFCLQPAICSLFFLFFFFLFQYFTDLHRTISERERGQERGDMSVMSHRSLRNRRGCVRRLREVDESKRLSCLTLDHVLVPLVGHNQHPHLHPLPPRNPPPVSTPSLPMHVRSSTPNAQNGGGHGGRKAGLNGNHLLNFSLPTRQERPAAPRRSRKAGGGEGARWQIFNKEKVRRGGASS